MKKAFLGLGVILLFIGTIAFSISVSVDELESNQLVTEEKDLAVQMVHPTGRPTPIGKWEISAQFDKGEELFVLFKSVNPENLIIDHGLTIVDVNITSPSGGNTTFRVLFTDSLQPDVNITLWSKDNDSGLIVSDPVEGIGGVAEYDGLYTATVYTIYPHLIYPPDGTLAWLSLYKTIVEKKYPYFTVLPLGIVLVVAGATLSIWGAKSSKKPTRLRRKRGQG